MKRKICVVTGSRAEYGILYRLMKEITGDPDLSLQLVVTGSHLSPEFGLTYKLIESDGFFIDKKVEITLSSDTPSAISKSVGLGCCSFVDAYNTLEPRLIVLLGDRYEMLAAAISAYILRIPIAHLHGGESTQGALDEAFRHSITKMSAIHFTAAEEYRKRVIQLGENPGTVYNYGAPGLDNIYHMKLKAKSDVEKKLNFKIDDTTALITYHPVTLENNSSEQQIDCILKVVKRLNIKAIFTASNSDPNGRIINNRIKSFCEDNPSRFRFYESLGQVTYLSCMKYLNLMIGNTSSGIIEAPTFKIPVINIGDRQLGRVKADNIIDVRMSFDDILKGAKQALSDDFKEVCVRVTNPYDRFMDGKVSHRIKEELKKMSLDEILLKKEFFDLSFSYNEK